MSTCPALVHRGHVHLSRLCPLGCPRVVPSIPTRPDPTRNKTSWYSQVQSVTQLTRACAPDWA